MVRNQRFCTDHPKFTRQPLTTIPYIQYYLPLTPLPTIQTRFSSLIQNLTTNDCTLKEMFESSQDIDKQDHDLFMTKLEIDSLYTYIPLEETTDMSCSCIFRNDNEIKLKKTDFKSTFKNNYNESYLFFDNNNSQKDCKGILLLIYLCNHEKK